MFRIGILGTSMLPLYFAVGVPQSLASQTQHPFQQQLQFRQKLHHIKRQDRQRIQRQLQRYRLERDLQRDQVQNYIQQQQEQFQQRLRLQKQETHQQSQQNQHKLQPKLH